jgi:hypothetical protein
MKNFITFIDQYGGVEYFLLLILAIGAFLFIVFGLRPPIDSKNSDVMEGKKNVSPKALNEDYSK